MDAGQRQVEAMQPSQFMLEPPSSKSALATEIQYPLLLLGEYLPAGRRLRSPAKFVQTIKAVSLKSTNPLAEDGSRNAASSAS